MDWTTLMRPVRYGQEDRLSSPELARTEFQRDYDRLVFSSPFRRLQNKTQVFPLPGSVFVHNRLTHSLEVASIGRSLGSMLAFELRKRQPNLPPEILYSLDTVVMTACLAHDLGNPPFGHSGEKAISEFFTNGQGQELQHQVSPWQWADLTHFEGNANALRMLIHQFTGRRKGGFALTYPSLAALVKYPYSSEVAGGYKYGFFQPESEAFNTIAVGIGLPASPEGRYARHPLVYLVEAADDISYQLMDLEDAHRLGILTTDETRKILLAYLQSLPGIDSSVMRVFAEVTDTNEQIAYLRARAIGRMTSECIGAFMENYEAIMDGTFGKRSLVSLLPGELKMAVEHCARVSVEKIYNYRSVVEIELMGYKVLSGLLGEFMQVVLAPDKGSSKKLLRLLPAQFQPSDSGNYPRIRGILDFISGMTDNYAFDLYRTLTGFKSF